MCYCLGICKVVCLTLTPLTWTKWWAPVSASKWQMGFNSAFKGLIMHGMDDIVVLYCIVTISCGLYFVL